MPEWVWKALQENAEVKADVLAVRLGAAFVLGLVSALFYHLSTRTPGKPPNRPFLATLVLLSVLVALVMTVIGESQARAFSLVGTLALVRFRTVVEDTRDSAFVILTVGMGMAAGVGFILAPVVALPLVLLAGLLFRAPAVERGRRAVVVLRLASTHPPGPALVETLAKLGGRPRLVGMETARGGAALDVRYLVTLPPADALVGLVGELSRIEGVQGVEVKEAE